MTGILPTYHEGEMAGSLLPKMYCSCSSKSMSIGRLFLQKVALLALNYVPVVMVKITLKYQCYNGDVTLHLIIFVPRFHRNIALHSI